MARKTPAAATKAEPVSAATTKKTTTKKAVADKTSTTVKKATKKKATAADDEATVPPPSETTSTIPAVKKLRAWQRSVKIAMDHLPKKRRSAKAGEEVSDAKEDKPQKRPSAKQLENLWVVSTKKRQEDKREDVQFSKAKKLHEEILQDVAPDARLSAVAHLVLRCASGRMVVDRFAGANRILVNQMPAKGQTVQTRHTQLCDEFCIEPWIDQLKIERRQARIEQEVAKHDKLVAMRREKREADARRAKERAEAAQESAVAVAKAAKTTTSTKKTASVKKTPSSKKQQQEA
jgi:hypothetical protein